MVSDDCGVQVVGVSCEVTKKGPESPSTVTVMSSLADEAPPASLSLTEYLNFIVLDTEGTTSQVDCVCPASTVASLGMYLLGDGKASSDLNIGPNTDVFDGGILPIC